MAGSKVPTATSLDQIYASEALLSQGKRWHDLVAQFKSLYGKLPDFISRAPGRVNIIGEVGPISILALILISDIGD